MEVNQENFHLCDNVFTLYTFRTYFVFSKFVEMRQTPQTLVLAEKNEGRPEAWKQDHVLCYPGNGRGQ